MKVKNIFSKHISFGAIVIALVSLSFGSCKENIDDSDLYTFTGEMLIDHLVNHPDTFSSDYVIASNQISASSFAVMHGIDGVLNYKTLTNGRYDSDWNTTGAAKRFIKNYQIKD